MDPSSLINRYRAKAGFTFQALVDPRPRTAKAADANAATTTGHFKVEAFPANYLLGAGGKILWRECGFDEQTVGKIREALKKAGVE